MEYFGVDRCYYCDVEDNNSIIRRDSSIAELSSVVGVCPLSCIPIHRGLMEAGQPFIVTDVHKTEFIYDQLKQLCIQIKVISYLYVRVVKGGKLVGLLCITNSSFQKWTELETELAAEVAERT